MMQYYSAYDIPIVIDRGSNRRLSQGSNRISLWTDRHLGPPQCAWAFMHHIISLSDVGVWGWVYEVRNTCDNMRCKIPYKLLKTRLIYLIVPEADILFAYHCDKCQLVSRFRGAWNNRSIKADNLMSITWSVFRHSVYLLLRSWCNG